MSISTRVARDAATVMGKSSTASVSTGKIRQVQTASRDYTIVSTHSSKLNQLWRTHN